MSTNAIGAKESSDEPDTDISAPIGIDPLYSDCVIKTKSGSVYHTTTGTLVACSPVFKGIVECCEGNASSSKARKLNSSGSKLKTDSKPKLMEMPLDDPEEEIAALVEHLHQPDRLLGSLIPDVTKEGAMKVLRLASIAFKYDIQGTLRQIDAILGQPAALAQFISHHDDGKVLATWAFACQFRLESVLAGVEAHIQSHPRKITAGVDDADHYATSLPSSSTDLGLSSLMFLLLQTPQRWEELATGLDTKCDKLIKEWPREGAKGAKLHSDLKDIHKLVKDLGPG